jgi:hypothetical protein
LSGNVAASDDGTVAVRRALHESFAQRRRLLRHGREQQLILRGVVPVEGPERDLGPGRDVAHLDRVVAAFCRQRGRSRDEPFLASGGLGGPASGHASLPGRTVART